MNKNLLILGAGMFGTVVKEIALEKGVFEKIDFLDDTFDKGEFEGNYHEQSIGKLCDYEKLVVDYSHAIVSIGEPEIRMEWTKKLLEAGYNIPTIVSNRAYVSTSSQLGRGVVVSPMVAINANSHIGEGAFVLAGAVIDHNTFVADYCNLQCGTVVMPGALLPNFTKTQPNEVVRKTPFSFTLENQNGELVFKGEPMNITSNGDVEN